jgi:uracil-DNA glycosylase
VASGGSTRARERFAVDACLPWLWRELATVEPDVLVILGVVAGKARVGARFRLKDVSG